MLLMDGHDELEKLFQIAAIKLHAYNIDALVSCTHVTQKMKQYPRIQSLNMLNLSITCQNGKIAICFVYYCIAL